MKIDKSIAVVFGTRFLDNLSDGLLFVLIAIGGCLCIHGCARIPLFEFIGYLFIYALIVSIINCVEWLILNRRIHTKPEYNDIRTVILDADDIINDMVVEGCVEKIKLMGAISRIKDYIEQYENGQIRLSIIEWLYVNFCLFSIKNTIRHLIENHSDCRSYNHFSYNWSIAKLELISRHESYGWSKYWYKISRGFRIVKRKFSK